MSQYPPDFKNVTKIIDYIYCSNERQLVKTKCKFKQQIWKNMPGLMRASTKKCPIPTSKISP